EIRRSDWPRGMVSMNGPGADLEADTINNFCLFMSRVSAKTYIVLTAHAPALATYFGGIMQTS
ncbi:MAG TPA: hypothetical protein DCL45_02895, partial [Chloroflexi bacterium]|nr:hypothetical protein [Chloroflexota bacterium]